MTVRLLLECTECGNTGFIYKDGGFECLACGEFLYPEDMGTKVVEQHELLAIVNGKGE